MNGQLAQLVALAAHGTSFLRGAGLAPDLLATNSTFRYLRGVTFSRVSRRFGLIKAEEPIASDTASWFRGLRDRQCRAIDLVRLHRGRRPGGLAPHIEVAFANGVDVGLLAVADRPELWLSSWHVVSRDAPDQRIWSVHYQGARVSDRFPAASVVDDAAHRLGAALDDARQCAVENGWEDWAERLAGASGQLTAVNPEIRFHPDMLPNAGYGLAAQQLLAAVTHGWVLGGMGSWNDLAPRDTARYTAVTAELYEALIGATIAGANAYGI